MMNKLEPLITLMVTFLLIAAKGESAPAIGLSLYGMPKYAQGFTHYAHVNPKAPKKGKISFGVVGTFDSLNPFIIKGTPAAGLTPLYASLVNVTLLDFSPEEPFTGYGYLAEGIELGRDHLSVTFYLRKEATFHDGSPLTAEDVAFSFKTLLKEGNPLYRNYYGDVKEVEILNPYAIRFIFKTSINKELPLVLGQFPIISKKYYTSHPFNKSSLEIPLGNGPYKVKSLEPGHEIIYERVGKWWGDDLPVIKGRYNFQEISYLYFRDDEVAFEAFKNGTIDFRQEVKIKNWRTGYNFEAVQKGKVHKQEIPMERAGRMQGLFFNTRRDIFVDRRVREALQYAFDFEWINENYFHNAYERINSYFWGTELASQGLPTPAEQKVLEPYKGKLPPEIFTKTYEVPKSKGNGNDRNNLLRARQLLEEAGWTLQGQRLIHKKTGRSFEFEILLNGPAFVKILNSFVQNLKRLGIKATLRPVDTSQYTARLDNFDFDTIVEVVGQSLSPGNEQREMWGSKVANVPGSRNWPGIQDPVVDQVIEDLIKAPDRKTLIALTHALDRVLLWGYYVIPLWGSRVEYFAYWTYLKNTGKFPPYNMDIFAWWHE